MTEKKPKVAVVIDLSNPEGGSWLLKLRIGKSWFVEIAERDASESPIWFNDERSVKTAATRTKKALNELCGEVEVETIP